MPNINNMKQDIKNAILGDMGAGGFLGFGSLSLILIKVFQKA
jgi:hypothetical protein